MALQAVVGVGSMDETRNVGGVLILVAREAERCGRWCDQLNSCNLFVCAHFVTTEAVNRSLGVGRLGIRFVRMARDALCRIDVGVECRVPGCL